jgi:hypothetical protein
VTVAAPGRLIHRSDAVADEDGRTALPAWTVAWWRLESGS